MVTVLGQYVLMDMLHDRSNVRNQVLDGLAKLGRGEWNVDCFIEINRNAQGN